MTAQQSEIPAEKRARKWLERAYLRPTRQRLALAELLIGDGRNRHVTAETLYEAALLGEEGVSLATVYNTLRAFCDADLMTEITIGGNKSYFDTRTDDHPHFYWEDDGTLSDAPIDAVKFANVPQAPEGAEISRVDVVIRVRRT